MGKEPLVVHNDQVVEPGAQFLWAPPEESGRIVSMVQWHDHIIIACEYALYRVRQKDGDDVTVEKLESG